MQKEVKQIVFNKEIIEKICSEQDTCIGCPLSLGKIVEEDSVYDFHRRIICCKHNTDSFINAINYIVNYQIENKEKGEIKDGNSNN